MIGTAIIHHLSGPTTVTSSEASGAVLSLCVRWHFQHRHTYSYLYAAILYIILLELVWCNGNGTLTSQYINCDVDVSNTLQGAGITPRVIPPGIMHPQNG